MRLAEIGARMVLLARPRAGRVPSPVLASLRIGARAVDERAEGRRSVGIALTVDEEP